MIEQKSLAILLYYLKSQGIVRRIAENDYGIDLEYELSHNQFVYGKTLKIQLKAKRNIRVNRDNTLTISKIKQSTLNYWAQVSYYSNVLLVVVDIEKEQIHVSDPIFWDAVKLIDNTERTKSIKIEMHEDPNAVSLLLINAFTLAPCFSEVRLYHKMALNMIKGFIEEWLFSKCCDYDTEVDDYYNFDCLLEISKTLLWNIQLDDKVGKINKEKRWYDRSSYYNSCGYINYRDINKTYYVLLDHLIKYLIDIREKMIASFMFWVCKDMEYYKYVLSFDITRELLTNSERFSEFGRLDDYKVQAFIDKQIKEVEWVRLKRNM